MFEQTKLTYAADALAPQISALTVETHYGKHHAAYTKAFNELAEKAGVAGQTPEGILAGLDSIADPALRTALRNNGGGYYNHNLYFSTLTPGGSAPTGALAQKIDEAFGSLNNLLAELKALALAQFGSGWAFLSVTPAGELVTSKSANQDNPISEGSGNTPIAAVDVWEHAYYLDYKNLRAAYVDKLFEILDWAAISARYAQALG